MYVRYQLSHCTLDKIFPSSTVVCINRAVLRPEVVLKIDQLAVKPSDETVLESSHDYQLEHIGVCCQ